MDSERKIVREAAVDWTYIPPELLQLIASKLEDIFDCIRLRTVCRTWRCSVGPKDLQPQIPWLIVPIIGSPVVYFVNPSTNRGYILDLPQAQGKRVIGSLHGWLVMIEDDPANLQPEVTLINPVTKAQILLPRLPNMGAPLCQVSNALLCFNPVEKIMVVIWSSMKLFLFRHGDSNWCEIEAPCPSYYGSMAYFEKVIYVANNKGRTLATIDNASLALHPIIEKTFEGEFIKIRLAETRGMLSLIAFAPKMRIQLFKLDRSEGELNWERVKDGMSNHRMFMTHGQLISSVRDFPFGDGLCFYSLTGGTHLYVYNDGGLAVESTKIWDVRRGTMFHDTWLVPSLH